MKITVDAVVFAYLNNELNVLLIERNFDPFKNQYALPGGFINENETAIDAVLRKLKEETNVESDYLEQLYTFTDLNRDPRGRIITIAYYGLINPNKHDLISNIHAKKVKWQSINELNFQKIKLGFDHNCILEYALTRLRNKIQYEPIGFELLPKYFTMSQLWELYNAILGYKSDRRNFNRKILGFNLLNETQMKSEGSIGKPAKLYEFNKIKYNQFLKNGFNFEI